LAVGGEATLAAATLAVGSLVSVAYWRSRAEDPGITTGVALILTLLLGGLATRNAPVAVALGVTLTLVLAGKARLHDFVRRVLTADELHDALMLAAAALVVLPLMPDRYLGPFDAFNPRMTWLVVVLMMAIGIVGHVAQRWLGPGVGLAASGFASGFVSSIATIASMGERVRQSAALLRPAVAGAVLSSVATIVQLAGLLAATSLPTLEKLALPLLLCGLASIAYAAFLTLRSIREPAPAAETAGHAFSVTKALGLAATVSLVTLLSAALQAGFGTAGLSVGVAITGFVDTHAAAISTASLVASGKLAPGDAVLPILCGLTTNTLTKIVVAASGGHRQFTAQVVPGLLALVGAAWVGFAFIAH
jgi:uncharacterized membrane protein (DUF4010 family)